jgi:hypothetical protein
MPPERRRYAEHGKVNSYCDSYPEIRYDIENSKMHRLQLNQILKINSLMKLHQITRCVAPFIKMAPKTSKE